MGYLESLDRDRAELKPKIESLLASHDVIPVGNGFIDLITPQQKALRLLESMFGLGVAVNAVTLWCDASDQNRGKYGCPHGFGGPRHKSGFYSEICESDSFDVSSRGVDIEKLDEDASQLVTDCNRAVSEYLTSGISARGDYRPCFVPGFWLHVPKSWERELYFA